MKNQKNPSPVYAVPHPGYVLPMIQAAMIAAIYVVLTFIANAFGLANYAIQVRFSEALTILPYFTPTAIPGLVIGCFLSNILTGCALPDIIFGTLATLIGAVLTYELRKFKWLAPIPPIVANAVIVPFVLLYAYGIKPLAILYHCYCRGNNFLRHTGNDPSDCFRKISWSSVCFPDILIMYQFIAANAASLRESAFIFL